MTRNDDCQTLRHVLNTTPVNGNWACTNCGKHVEPFTNDNCQTLRHGDVHVHRPNVVTYQRERVTYHRDIVTYAKETAK